MKRNTMIRIIDDLLISRGFHKAGSLDLAIMLLDKIEEAGMLPPDQNKDAEPPCAVLTYWEEE